MSVSCAGTTHNSQIQLASPYRSAENSMVACTCTNHILYIAVMQGMVHLKCFVLYICTPLSWTAAASATLAGGKSQLLEKALSAGVTRTW